MLRVMKAESLWIINAGAANLTWSVRATMNER